MLDNASYAIFLMDDRQQCIYMNAAAEQLTGYTLGEILALDMPLEERKARWKPMFECVRDENVQTWTRDILADLSAAPSGASKGLTVVH